MRLEGFASEAMGLLLDKPGDAARRLRSQHAKIVAASRDLTGVGFFVNFATEDAGSVEGLSFTLGAISGSAENLVNGFGILLFVVNFKLKALEGFTYDEPWPEKLVDPVVTLHVGLNAHDNFALRDADLRLKA